MFYNCNNEDTNVFDELSFSCHNMLKNQFGQKLFLHNDYLNFLQVCYAKFCHASVLEIHTSNFSVHCL